MARIIKVKYGAEELRRRLALVAAAFADSGAVADGLKLRLAVVFFSKVKDAFITKARGGTDDAGISWPPLNPKTLAYSRQTQAGKSRVLKTTTKQRQRAGFNRYQSLRAYNVAYREALARLSLTLPKAEARRRASNIATVAAQQKSGQTKIDAASTLRPGVDYDILRDTGILLNSLQPGIVSGDTYSPRDNQIALSEPGQLVLGTNVEYAGAHHYGNAQRGLPARPLWPRPNALPQSWLNAMNDALTRGISKAIEQAAA